MKDSVQQFVDHVKCGSGDDNWTEGCPGIGGGRPGSLPLCPHPWCYKGHTAHCPLLVNVWRAAYGWCLEREAQVCLWINELIIWMWISCELMDSGQFWVEALP